MQISLEEGTYGEMLLTDNLLLASIADKRFLFLYE